MARLSPFDTHEVLNQSPAFEDVDLFTTDRPLQDAVRANGAEGEKTALTAFGRHWGAADMFAQARRANTEAPRLVAFDTKGFRCDVVEFHPAYHPFMAESIEAGLHAMTWRATGVRAAAPSEVARAARYYMVAQVENGHMCPVTMTRAAGRMPRPGGRRRGCGVYLADAGRARCRKARAGGGRTPGGARGSRRPERQRA